MRAAMAAAESEEAEDDDSIALVGRRQEKASLEARG